MNSLVKDSGGTYWSQGWNYLVDLVAPYWLWVPLLAVAAVAILVTRDKSPGRSLVPLLALPVGGILHALFIVESGGDYLHAPLLLSSLFAIIAPFSVVPWRPQFRIPVIVVGVLALLAGPFPPP